MLELIGLKFRVQPPEEDEPDLSHLPPAEAVRQLARAKCMEVSGKASDNCLIIAADTMVYAGGALMGKPKSPEHAEEMLQELSGKKHSVYTGIAVMLGGRIICDSQKTDVFFRSLTKREISAYVATGEPMDKAGAYGVQGRAALFVERIEGDYYNAVGLPLCKLGQMVSEMGVELL